MTRRSSLPWLLLVWLAACKGREITVFELPTETPGAGAAAGGTAGTSGSAGAAGGGGSAAGADEQPEAGRGGALGGTAGESTSGGGGSAGSSEGGDTSVGGKPSGTPCTTNDDCDLGWSCEKSGCKAASGVCQRQPSFGCPPDPSPVCGCNGVTYWNDCTRRFFGGTQLDSIGECVATASACETGPDCDVPYGSCSHLLPGDMCGHGAGTCWVLPPDCDKVPAEPGARQWRLCLGPGMGLGGCVNSCYAIASERSHIRADEGGCQ